MPFNLHTIHPNTPVREQASDRPLPFENANLPFETRKQLMRPFVEIEVFEITGQFGNLSPETIEQFNITDAPDEIESFLLEEITDKDWNPQAVKDKWFATRLVADSM